MLWFKHYSDNHRGQSVQILLDELSYFGPFFYYTLYEICTEKLQREPDAELTEDRCKFRLHRRVVCSATRAKPSTVERALVLGQSCGLWTFSKDGDFFEISIPILLNLLDRDSKKPRLNRAKIAPETRLDIEENKNQIKNQNKKKKVITNVITANLEERPEKPSAEIVDLTVMVAKPPQVEGTSIVIAKYCEAYKKRYGTNPPVMQKAAGQLKQLTKELGVDKARQFVEAYLSMNDSWFMQKHHDVTTLLQNTNKVGTFMTTGRAVTRQEASRAEASDSFQNTLAAIARGEV